jgi:hypothetical protein
MEKRHDAYTRHFACTASCEVIATMESIGRKRWAIAEGYIPSGSHGPSPQMTSHETVCLLNTSDRDAHIRMTVFYTDREPVGPYQLVVPGRRTRHIRFNDLTDPEPIPLDTDFASLIESDIPIIVQHTRLDSRQAENALLSTIAFAGDV